MNSLVRDNRARYLDSLFDQDKSSLKGQWCRHPVYIYGGPIFRWCGFQALYDWKSLDYKMFVQF